MVHTADTMRIEWMNRFGDALQVAGVVVPTGQGTRSNVEGI